MSYSSQGERISIGVKAHVLYSRLLTVDDYWGLLGSDTVVEVAQKLLATSYEESLSTLPAEPHRYDVEAAVKTVLVKGASSFMIHLSDPRDRFFRAWVRWHEADNLKSIFRHVAAGRMDRDELRRRLYISKNSTVSYENLLSARDFSELSEALAGSPYHRVLEDPMKRLATGEEHSLFPLEMALDGFVELSLSKAMKKLGSSERKMLLPIFGARIDLYNLYTLYRAVTFYDMTPEETLNRLLPARYRVTLAFLRAAVRAASMEQVIDMMKEAFPKYAEVLIGSLREEEPQLTLERNIKRYIYMEARRVFGSGPPDFHTAMSYFMLKESEITDIIRIIEYVRYGYDRRKAAEYLIRPITSGGETEWQ